MSKDTTINSLVDDYLLYRVINFARTKQCQQSSVALEFRRTVGGVNLRLDQVDIGYKTLVESLSGSTTVDH
jgi:hypothetical protein